MQRRRQSNRAQLEWTKPRSAPARLDHGHVGGPVNLVLNADPPVKPKQICAASEQHVLAIVDRLANARMEIGAGAPAKITALLNQMHAQPSLGQRASCAHACHAAADDRDGLSRCFNQVAQMKTRTHHIFARPASMIRTFSCIGTLARRENTS